MSAKYSTSVGYDNNTYAFFADGHGDRQIRMVSSPRGRLRIEELYCEREDAPVRASGAMAATVVDGTVRLYVVESSKIVEYSAEGGLGEWKRENFPDVKLAGDSFLEVFGESDLRGVLDRERKPVKIRMYFIKEGSDRVTQYTYSTEWKEETAR